MGRVIACKEESVLMLRGNFILNCFIFDYLSYRLVFLEFQVLQVPLLKKHKDENLRCRQFLNSIENGKNRL